MRDGALVFCILLTPNGTILLTANVRALRLAAKLRTINRNLLIRLDCLGEEKAAPSYQRIVPSYNPDVQRTREKVAVAMSSRWDSGVAESGLSVYWRLEW